ncbi:MAG: hypothetical protein SNH79_03740 [Rikenellaceae bacterium]
MKGKILWMAAAMAIAISCGGDNQLKSTLYSDGLQYGEGSVVYGSTLLISNFGIDELNPLNSEGKGYIAQFDGDQIKPFIVADGNLSAPKGMAIKDDFLYVADVSKVVIYNLQERDAAPKIVKMPFGNQFVNDIAISGDTAYISVTNSGRIFALDISSPNEISAKSLKSYARVVGANGLLIDGNTMYVASCPADGVTTQANVIYKIEDLAAPVVTKLMERPGQYDGLAKSGEKLYFTNWVAGELGYVDLHSGEVVVESLSGDVALSGPADMSLFNGALYIPDLPTSRLVKVAL